MCAACTSACSPPLISRSAARQVVTKAAIEIRWPSERLCVGSGSRRGIKATPGTRASHSAAASRRTCQERRSRWAEEADLGECHAVLKSLFARPVAILWSADIAVTGDKAGRPIQPIAICRDDPRASVERPTRWAMGRSCSQPLFRLLTATLPQDARSGHRPGSPSSMGTAIPSRLAFDSDPHRAPL